jgi:carbon monoxide dehydrogenase subunit G
MTMRQSVHIEAPVEKVFDFFKDPENWEGFDETVQFKDVKRTREGVGTSYSWVGRIGPLKLEGFNVFTDFVPNQRIIDKSSRAFEGTWTYSFEPEGSGTKVTFENRGRSLWAIPPLSTLLDRSTAKGHEKSMRALKERMEA